MKRLFRIGAVTAASALALGGCGFSPYDLPLPGGADLGNHPYTVKVQFRDVLDLVPQSGVRVNDIAVGKVTSIKLDGWTALVTLKINKDAKLPDNAEATIRQTSLLGEKFVSLAPPTEQRRHDPARPFGSQSRDRGSLRRRVTAVQRWWAREDQHDHPGAQQDPRWQ
jgi:virulence factor Mce-like protein